MALSSSPLLRSRPAGRRPRSGDGSRARGVSGGHGEVAERSGRDALAQLDVDARCLQLAQVLVAVVDGLQLAALVALHGAGHVVVDQGLGVVGAYQVVQLDAVVVHAQVGVGPWRQHHAEVHALGALGLQCVVANGEEGRVLARARHVRITRVGHAAVGDAGAVGVLRQRRCTEALRRRGTHQQEIERLPAQADLRRERIAEIIVVIGARRRTVPGSRPAARSLRRRRH